MKKLYIILILIVVAVAHILIIGYHRHKRTNVLEEYIPPANVVIEEMINQQVSAMKLLTVEETVQQLDRMEYYFWPGSSIGAGTLFGTDESGNIAAESLYKQDKIELEKILSSRLFRKALQDMGELPKDQASILLKKELDNALKNYLELYNGFFESRSVSFRRGELADGRPVFTGFRNKLLALMLIAGSLELTDVHYKIKEVDSIAQNQKEEVTRIEDTHIKINYTLGALLHNNLILSSGLYGTSPRKGDAALKPFSDQFSIHQIVDFSAPGTEYDTMVLHGVQELVPDEEYINVHYFEQMTNEDLDELRRILALP